LPKIKAALYKKLKSGKIITSLIKVLKEESRSGKKNLKEQNYPLLLFQKLDNNQNNSGQDYSNAR
jgi:hypothetical protein